MDRFTKKQQEINHRASEVIVDYPALWSETITEWSQPGPEDRAWLMYSANYLLDKKPLPTVVEPEKVLPV